MFQGLTAHQALTAVFCLLLLYRYCCGRRARASSFTLWQQATIEITRQDHSVPSQGSTTFKQTHSTFHRVHMQCQRSFAEITLSRPLNHCLFAPCTYTVGAILSALPVRGASRMRAA